MRVVVLVTVSIGDIAGDVRGDTISLDGAAGEVC